MFKKTITTDFFSTISFRQAIKSLNCITFRLAFLRKWKDIKKVEKIFKNFLWISDAKIISFYNWRSAIYHILKALWLNKDDEVIVNAYNCVSISNAVIQAWVKIIYSDIDKDNLSFDIIKLNQSITKKTKVIIVQHTFWKIADIQKIINLAHKKWILVIEDCAHSLWTTIKWRQTWTFWDFAIFSTWRDKVISSVTWGFLVINNKNYFKLTKEIKSKLILASRLLIIKNHLYNLIAYKAYKLYDFFWLWKVIIHLSRKLNIITEILTKKEKKCNFKDFNYSFPNSLAYLLIPEINLLHEYKRNRRAISDVYDLKIKDKDLLIIHESKTEKCNFYRYPILLKNKKITNSIIEKFKAQNILLWKSWTWINIAPKWSNLKNANYKIWSCPIAESLASRIITLPNNNNLNKKDIDKVINFLNNI